MQRGEKCHTGYILKTKSARLVTGFMSGEREISRGMKHDSKVLGQRNRERGVALSLEKEVGERGTAGGGRRGVGVRSSAPIAEGGGSP